MLMNVVGVYNESMWNLSVRGAKNVASISARILRLSCDLSIFYVNNYAEVNKFFIIIIITSPN